MAWGDVRRLVDKQAEDPVLWLPSSMPRVEYLQAALRELHAAVEEANAEALDEAFEQRTRE